jgi:hypothetical protein
MQTIHILQIEDNAEHRKQFKTLAWRLGTKQSLEVVVTSFDNLKEGYLELEKNMSKYKALVLDAKCIIQKGENESFEFLPKALRELGEINRKTGQIHLPFAINTGYYGYETVKVFTREITEQGGKLFDKSDEENMLAFLFGEIAKLENTKIEKQYADVFEVFDLGYLSISLKQDLLTCLKKLDNPTQIKNNFNPLRKILEAIYQAIKTKDATLIPDNVYFGRANSINLDWTWLYLSGRPVKLQNNTTITAPQALFPKHIGILIKSFEENTSTISHIYVPSVEIYAYKSTVFSLLEILLWFKELMKTL